jgi:succinate dehydrogenase / fumarate reductase cytochrome b subunit
MENTKQADNITLKRDLLSLSEWRSTQIGMWAWLMQRISALLIVVFIALHLVYPYQVYIQTCMAFFLCMHAVLGLRVILLDIGARATLHKVYLAGLLLLGFVLFVIVLKLRIFYI